MLTRIIVDGDLNNIVGQKTSQPDIGVEIKFRYLETFLLANRAAIFRNHLNLNYCVLLHTLDHQKVDDTLTIKF